jgi:hypothetical protein
MEVIRGYKPLEKLTEQEMQAAIKRAMQKIEERRKRCQSITLTKCAEAAK